MPESGGSFENLHAKKNVKLPLYLLVDCTFITPMLKFPLYLKFCLKECVCVCVKGEGQKHSFAPSTFFKYTPCTGLYPYKSPFTSQWVSPGPSTNKTDSHDIVKILLKVALNTIQPTNNPNYLPLMKDTLIIIKIFSFIVI